MKSNGVAAVEMTYTALARIAAASGDAERAYEMVRYASPARPSWSTWACCRAQPFDVTSLIMSSQIAEMRASGLQPKLRTFTPALQCFCESGNIERVRMPGEALVNVLQ
jgi:hypothetical protein